MLINQGKTRSFCNFTLVLCSFLSLQKSLNQGKVFCFKDFTLVQVGSKKNILVFSSYPKAMKRISTRVKLAVFATLPWFAGIPKC